LQHNNDQDFVLILKEHWEIQAGRGWNEISKVGSSKMKIDVGYLNWHQKLPCCTPTLNQLLIFHSALAWIFQCSFYFIHIIYIYI